MARYSCFSNLFFTVITKICCFQARINDSTPLSDNERITGFINAQKLLKMLKCSLCEKVFRSGLGYKFHQEICGKDVSI